MEDFTHMLPIECVIRKYDCNDRDSVRRISYETAFLECPRKLIFDDDEILADALTLYFTDYEPESCFVAVADNKVVGYIIGSKDAADIKRVFGSKIIIPVLIKAFSRGVFFKLVNLKYFFHVLLSALKREFIAPELSKDFPSLLHINIDEAYRGQGIGERLIQIYLAFLKEEGSRGVHFGTISERAVTFFLGNGFNILFQNKRTYLKPYFNKAVNFYIFGRKL
jgi:GNAT superfamily N-acetyltransferase